MSESKKRRSRHTDSESNKKNKTKNYWSKASKNFQSVTGIDAGIQGIFATCERGREPKCVGEMYGMLEKCAKELYGIDPPGEEEKEDEEEEEEEEDIEAAIQREISGLKAHRGKKGAGGGGDGGGEEDDKRLFVNVKLDLNCVVFFRTKAPTVPTEIVHALLSGKVQSRSMWTHRLTPVMRTGKATLEGLAEVAREVLKPWFHEGQTGVKYAIRPTSRNHSVMSRDEIIKTVADLVGPAHKVDLGGYDVLVLVDVFKNVCGMSVVRDFERLGKYNLQVAHQQQQKQKQKEAQGPAATATTTATALPEISTEKKNEGSPPPPPPPPQKKSTDDHDHEGSGGGGGGGEEE